MKQWTFVFETTALDVLARRPEEVSPDAYRLFAEPCARHDASCVRVIYGALVDHFPWKKTDPAALAATLLATMLPSLTVRSDTPAPARSPHAAQSMRQESA